MIRGFLRKLLYTFGLLELYRTLRRKVRPPQPVFAPCTPHLLIAVHKGLRWIKENISPSSCDYLEFGIYSGFTLWYAQKSADDLEIPGMRFFGFDSFEGLPRPRGVDADWVFSEGEYRCSRAVVEKFIEGWGGDWSRLFLVEGWYQKSLTPALRQKHGLKRCGLCVIDCDFYESAQAALNFIAPLIQDSCIILFDDWNPSGQGRPDAGEQLAFAEFLKEHPDFEALPFVTFGTHGKGFLIQSRRRS